MSRNNDTAETASHVADRIRDKAAEVTQEVRDIGGKVRDAATESYGHVRDQASQYIHQGRETAHEWEESLEDYVQKKPLQAVLLAAGVGLLVGLLWKRR